MQDYWLARYMDERGINTIKKAKKWLDKKGQVETLVHEYAIPTDPNAPLPASDQAIVAGASLDLAGSLECTHPDCLKRKVDALLSRVWHYFDTVVVVGASPRLFSTLGENNDEGKETLLGHMATFLHLRKLGVEDIVVFRDRAAYCVEHLVPAADRVGATDFFDRRQDFVDSMVAQEVYTHPPRYHGKDRWHGWAKTPWGNYHEVKISAPEDASEAVLKRAGAERVFHELSDILVGDLLHAEAFKAPLATDNTLHGEWLDGRQKDIGQVAFELHLPMLIGVPPADLIRLRQQEREQFEVFRQSLATAMTERLKADPEARSADVAQQVVGDLIDPAMHNISRTLQVAQRAASRKTGTRVALATTVAGVGLMTGMPLVVAAGVGMYATLYQPVEKYFDDRREIELKDMYFLWTAQQRALGNPALR